MTDHAVVSRDEWLEARGQLLEEEQAHAARSEELAAKRRKLPWVRVEKEYEFELADQLDGGVVHMNHRDVTLMCISRAPLEKLQAYKRRMGWDFQWVSSNGSDFNFDFGFAFTEEDQKAPEFRELLDNPPEWLENWAKQVGTDLPTGLKEGPGWNAFALEDGVVYHTYTRLAPDRDLVVPYYEQLLDQTAKGRQDEFPAYRKDEYPS